MNGTLVCSPDRAGHGDLFAKAVAYLRQPREASDSEIKEVETGLRDLAVAKQLHVEELFTDESGSREAFDQLLRHLDDSGTHHVLIPTRDDLSSHGLLQELMLNRLTWAGTAEEIVVHLLELHDPRWAAGRMWHAERQHHGNTAVGSLADDGGDEVRVPPAPRREDRVERSAFRCASAIRPTASSGATTARP